MDNWRWYKVFIVKFRMSTCDAGDGIFKSYLTNISTGHSLNTATKGLLHSVWWYLITRSGKWSLKNILLYHFCAIYATTYTTRSYLDKTYLVQVTCEIQKLKFGSEHVQWTSRSQCFDVSVIRWSSHMSQGLRINWVTKGRHTLLNSTAQTHLRMHKTPPDVTLAVASIIETVDTPDIQGYIIKIITDMRQAITNHHADLNMVIIVPQISCYSR